MNTNALAVGVMLVLLTVICTANDFERENLRSVSEHRTSAWFTEIHSNLPNVDSVMWMMRADSSVRNGIRSLERYEAEEWLRTNVRNADADGFVRTITPKALTTQKKSSQVQADNVWRNIGPFTWDREANDETGSEGIGVLRTIAIHPDNPTNIVVGTISAGVWHSVDGGEHWTPTTDALDVQLVNDIEFAPSNPNIVLAATDVGLARSTDGGTTFAVVAFDTRDAFPSVIPVSHVAIHPSDPGRITVACNKALYESTDSGLTWEKIDNSSGEYWEVTYAPAGNTIYAVQNGNDWSEFVRFEYGKRQYSEGLPSPTPGDVIPRALIATSPSAPQCVWLMVGGKRDTVGGVWGLYKSTNYGKSFTKVCCGDREGPSHPTPTTPNVFDYSATALGLGQITWDMAFAVSNTDTALMVVGGIFPYVSTDGGQSWAVTSPIHYDIQDIVIIDSTLWISTDGGLQRSDDLGKTMYDRSEGICAVEVWGFGQSPHNNVMAIGAYHLPIFIRDDKVYDSRGYEGGWYPWSGADAMMADVNPDNASWLYVKPWGSVRAKRNPDKHKVPESKELGIDLGYLSFSNIAFHPNKTYTFYAADHSGPSVVTSDDNAERWHVLKTFKTSITHVRISTSNPTTLCAIADARLWYTTDGETWMDITPKDDISFGHRVVDVAFDPTDDQVLWVAFSGKQGDCKVALTTDAGQHWLNKSTGLLSDPVQCICIRPGSSREVFVGTSRGVFVWNESVNEWSVYGSELPRCGVYFMHPDETQALLRIGTTRGLWEANLNQAKPLAQISVSQDTVRCSNIGVMFTDRSSTCLSASSWRKWTFPGGTPEHSTERQPLVVYDTPGTYSASLVTGNSLGTDSAVLEHAVHVLPSECDRVTTVPGGCVDLSESADFVTLGTFAGETNTFTFTAWVKPNGYQPGFSTILCTDATGDYKGEVGMQFVNDSNEVGYLWKGGQWWWGSGLRLKPDEWNHVALIVNGEKGVTVMVNGVVSHLSISSLTQDLSKLTFTLGTYHHWASRNMNGLIDEVRLYSTALSEYDVRTQMYHPIHLETPGLLGWYQFNESGDNELYNLHTGFAGTLSNGAKRMQSSIPFGPGITDTIRLPSADPAIIDRAGLNARSRELQGHGLQLAHIDGQLKPFSGSGQPLDGKYFIVQSLGSEANNLESVAMDLHGLIGLQDAATRQFRLWAIAAYDTDAEWLEIPSTAFYDPAKHHVIFKLDSLAPARLIFLVSVDGGLVDVHEQQKPCSIRPVPANAIVYVDGLNVGQVYELVNALGEVVLRVYAEAESTVIHTGSLPQGMYMFRNNLFTTMIPIVH